MFLPVRLVVRKKGDTGPLPKCWAWYNCSYCPWARYFIGQRAVAQLAIETLASLASLTKIIRHDRFFHQRSCSKAPIWIARGPWSTPCPPRQLGFLGIAWINHPASKYFNTLDPVQLQQWIETLLQPPPSHCQEAKSARKIRKGPPGGRQQASHRGPPSSRPIRRTSWWPPAGRSP